MNILTTRGNGAKIKSNFLHGRERLMNLDFGPKHLTGLAWLLPLIATLLIVLLTIRKKKGYGEKFDRAVIRYT